MTRSTDLLRVLVLICLVSTTGYSDEQPEVLPAEEAARTMIVPDGFRVTLFAGEPDVQQPIGFCIDDRGRLWVAEAYNYPNHGTRPGDRILIFEDTDGDGKHDKRTVFYDQLNYVTGIEVGFGGAWVMSPPNFYFIPDRDADDRPDSDPIVLLDGFGNHANSHNLANGFAWGPDGWLYGTHGRTNWSEIGKPGSPAKERVRFDGGVYRYHPERHVWEPFADGTTNPWGIDWDDFGQAFVCNCVDPHLYHVIQGAHYEPWRNRDSSRYAYQRIKTIADHLHFIGKGNVHDGIGTAEEDAAGGGHAHCGTMIYLGDSWPEKYRNTVFMHNLHGHRINNDILKRAGSGYTASHGPDLMRARDQWYMGVTMQYGPDGSVYSLDWSDTGECHSVVNTQRTTGRIFRISYGDRSPVKTDLASRSTMELAELQFHRNDWFVRHARRLLQERAVRGGDLTAATIELKQRLKMESGVEKRLRCLWALFSIGQADAALLTELLSDESEHLRAWAIRLLSEDRELPAEIQQRLTNMATTDPSALVSLHLASAAQRMALKDRWSLVEALSGRLDFADDQNIPLMTWYAVEPLVEQDQDRFIQLGESSKIPIVRRHVARRVAGIPRNLSGIDQLIKAIRRADAETTRSDLLSGLLTGLEGTRRFDLPSAWSETYAVLKDSSEESVREQAQRLALIFQDPQAIQQLRRLAGDSAADKSVRQRAIKALAGSRIAGFDDQLIELTTDENVRIEALAGLAEYDHPATVKTVLNVYSTANATTRQAALQTLASRASWAKSLMAALESGEIARTEITAFTARQIHSLGDKQLSKDVERLWGPIRETPKDRARLITNYKPQLTAALIQSSNRKNGRALFQKSCANCHRLFESGTLIGPDLTGAQRTNVDYLLQNLLDPSASISKDYQMQIVATTNGRVITGLLIEESDNAITVQTATEKVIVPRNEIEEQKISDVSMMPEGILQKMTHDEVRDLFAYLMGSEQVAIP